MHIEPWTLDLIKWVHIIACYRGVICDRHYILENQRYIIPSSLEARYHLFAFRNFLLSPIQCI